VALSEASSVGGLGLRVSQRFDTREWTDCADRSRGRLPQRLGVLLVDVGAGGDAAAGTEDSGSVAGAKRGTDHDAEVDAVVAVSSRTCRCHSVWPRTTSSTASSAA
jgi:hypothetical protein